jgi:hypothetical protein
MKVISFVFLLFLAFHSVAKPNENWPKKCERFRYSNCPSDCKQVCRPSSCIKDGPCTSDCGGVGSCVTSDEASGHALKRSKGNQVFDRSCKLDSDCVVSCPVAGKSVRVGRGTCLNKTFFEKNMEEVTQGQGCQTDDCKKTGTRCECSNGNCVDRVATDDRECF